MNWIAWALDHPFTILAALCVALPAKSKIKGN